jgi:hypothetical protein
LKPDLACRRRDIYTATQSFDSRGSMYSDTGYTLVDGTSFSPYGAGAASQKRAARAQRRPVPLALINTAASADTSDGYHRDLQITGAACSMLRLPSSPPLPSPLHQLRRGRRQSQPPAHPYVD